jgi:hypothetical protein
MADQSRQRVILRGEKARMHYLDGAGNVGLALAYDSFRGSAMGIPHSVCQIQPERR